MGLNYNDVRCLMEWRRGDSGGKRLCQIESSVSVQSP